MSTCPVCDKDLAEPRDVQVCSRCYDGLLSKGAVAVSRTGEFAAVSAEAAAELLDPTRNGAVIYVGDGAPTVGELGADGLLTRMARLPTPVRLYAVGVGANANLDLLETLTHGGGLALRVEERSAAADAALEILAHMTERLPMFRTPTVVDRAPLMVEPMPVEPSPAEPSLGESNP